MNRFIEPSPLPSSPNDVSFIHSSNTQTNQTSPSDLDNQLSCNSQESSSSSSNTNDYSPLLLRDLLYGSHHPQLTNPQEARSLTQPFYERKDMTGRGWYFKCVLLSSLLLFLTYFLLLSPPFSLFN